MQRPRGTKDIYGMEQNVKQSIEDKVRKISQLFNYQKIETPIFEKIEVFKRTIGLSEIVVKELYEFKDKNQRVMALRPENTAPVVRAMIENNLLQQISFQKLYYLGQMFRYENPQKGRQRQFNQFGVENFSFKSPYVDAEIIIMANMILKQLNIKNKLVINSLGNQTTLNKFSQKLISYLSVYKSKLSENSQKRLENRAPLRILDDKNDCNHDFIKNMPFKISDFYSFEETQYFNQLLKILDDNQIKYQVNPHLVRGLDYYNDTVFEFQTLDNHQSQSTLIAGGRYDKLVDQIANQVTNISGVGFALGIERLIDQLLEKHSHQQFNELVYIVNLSSKKNNQANDNLIESINNMILKLAIDLRNNNFSVDWNVKPLSLKKSFSITDLLKPFAIITIGEKEFKSNQATIRIKSDSSLTKLVNFSQIISYLKTKKKELKNENNQ